MRSRCASKQEVAPALENERGQRKKNKNQPAEKQWLQNNLEELVVDGNGWQWWWWKQWTRRTMPKAVRGVWDDSKGLYYSMETAN